MKKSLIALAALAATASFAQSTVSISGVVDAGYRLTTGADNVKTQGVNGTGNAATTVLTVAGSEDLGGGLKANFQFQLTPDFVNGAGVAGSTVSNNALVSNAQQAFVGVSGSFGEVQAGRVNSNALDSWGVGSVFGTALGSGYGSNGNIYTRYSGTATATSQSAPTRFNGAVRYISPAFNGFSGSLLVVPKANTTSGEGVTDFGLKYANGPLNVMYSNQKIESSGTAATNSFLVGGLLANGSNKLQTLAANYTLGAATVYGAVWTEKQASAAAAAATTDTSGQMIGAKYAMGTVTLLASYGKSNDKTANNVDKKIYGLGADYALSKRSTLFARYENRDANTNDATANTANGTTKVTSFGIKHTF